MKKLLIFFAIFLFGVTGYAQSARSFSVVTGGSYYNIPFTAADTINASETYYIVINNFQNYPSMQDVWINLTDVSGTPSVTVTVYGKKFSGDTYVSLGTPSVWTDTDFVYGINASNRYRYYKIEFVASGATQQTLIAGCEFKSYFTNAESSTSLHLSGTLEVDGESTFNDHVNLTAGADLIGSATSDIAFGSTNFTVAGASGNTATAGDLAVDGTANLDNTDIDGTFTMDGTAFDVNSTTTVTIDNTNTGNGVVINAVTSASPVSIGHTTSETTVNDNLTVSGDADVVGAFTANSVVADADVTGVTVASITAANLVDKSAVEAVGGVWTFNAEPIFAVNAGAATFGAVATDADVVLAFDAVGNQGSLTYMNTEDRFDFDNDVDVIGDLTANTIASDGALSGTAITGTSVISPLYDATGGVGITFGSADITAFTFSGIDEDLVLTPSANTWTLSTTTGATAIAVGGLNLTGVGTIGSGKVSSTGGVDLGTSQALTGTTAITVGSVGSTTAITSSDWAISATGDMTNIGQVTTDSTVSFGSWGYDEEHVTLPETSSNTNAGLGMYAMVDYSATAGKVFAGAYHRMLAMTTNQTNQSTMVGSESQFRLRDVDIADGVHAGIWAYAEQSGTSEMTSNGTFDAISATVESASTFTVGASNSVTGITLESSINAGATISASANYSAVNIEASGLDWFNGIKIADVDNDILLQNDETIDNAVDGYVAISGIVQTEGISLTANVIQYTELVTLTATEIVGSDAGDIGHADGAVLVAAPATGTVLQFVSAILIYDYASAAYTDGGNDLVINIGSTGAQLAVVKTIASSFLLGASEDKMYTPYVEYSGGVGLPVLAGEALSLKSTAWTQPSTAAGVLRCYVTYNVITTGL